MSDFWISSGHHLLDRDDNRRLVVTDEFLKAYLARPEIVPPEDACAHERALHARLLAGPREPVEAGEIKRIADRDARENWRHLVAFRDHLLGHPTLEAAYLALSRSPKVAVPPLFLNQLVHVLLRNMLDGERDPFKLRAAEMFFRTQRLTMRDDVMHLADAEVVDGANVVDQTSPLVAIFGDARADSLDVLTAEAAHDYLHHRSDAHDFMLDFRHGEPGRAALARVLEAWVETLLGSAVSIEPVERIAEQNWSWFVGLDQDGTAIGNALWNGKEPADDGRTRIVALFRLTFAEPGDMLDEVAGQPVSLILGMTPNRIVRMKPQNILAGLPLKRHVLQH